MTGGPVRVVIAAGGLGTRVAGWAQVLPKEFQPVNGRPALLCLLDELADGGAEQAVLVYHRYYEPFFGWAVRALLPGGTARYRAAAGLPAAPQPLHETLRVSFVRQRGAYADITSVLNAATDLPAGPLYVAFADNLYPATNPLRLLRAVPGDSAAVLARPFDPAEAGRRGVIITNSADQMIGLVEKPDPGQTAALLHAHGACRLRLLEGRFRLPADLVAQLHSNHDAHPGEPRLSLAIAAYASTRPVHVVTTTAPVLDLGILAGCPEPAAVEAPGPVGRAHAEAVAIGGGGVVVRAGSSDRLTTALAW
jgi:UTP-glucose-1-phosphate uridylyltransferase